MRYAFAAPALLAVTVVAAPVSKRDEDVNINNLGVDNLDVLPQVSVNDIPKRSEDISIDGITPGIGVPTLLIPREDGDDVKREKTLIDRDGDDEQQEESNAGELGLGFLGFSKREETLTDGSNGDGDLLDIIDLRKRGDGNGETVDDSDSGPLDLGLRKREDIADDDIDKEIGEVIKTSKGVVKRDDSLFDDNILGGLLRKREEALLGLDNDDDDDLLGGLLDAVKKRDGALLGLDNDDDDDLLGGLLDAVKKRDETLITDGDENGNKNGDGGVLGLVNLGKREQDSDIGGVSGVDIGTPVLDAVNI
ncbi:hypothetical protein N7499_012424 [Penicillium canescens]|nr:hypothetical protein N7499_012424 [Penicillium canescens]KAJ6154762.1 hypothetical protein N7485_013131 [Penicillium canescens]